MDISTQAFAIPKTMTLASVKRERDCKRHDLHKSGAGFIPPTVTNVGVRVGRMHRQPFREQ